jgi:hypothetical protein
MTRMQSMESAAREAWLKAALRIEGGLASPSVVWTFTCGNQRVNCICIGMLRQLGAYARIRQFALVFGLVYNMREERMKKWTSLHGPCNKNSPTTAHAVGTAPV